MQIYVYVKTPCVVIIMHAWLCVWKINPLGLLMEPSYACVIISALGVFTYAAYICIVIYL